MSATVETNRSDYVWIAIYSAIILAWLALYWLSLAHLSAPILGVFDAAFDPLIWREWCAQTSAQSLFFDLAPMWLLMGVAMMLPTALPFLKTYQEVASSAKHTPAASVVGAALGYLGVWSIFSLTAAIGQTWLAKHSAMSAHGIILDEVGGAAILIGAGLYQLSSLKAGYLAKCQQPMMYLFSHWRSGRRGAIQMGAQHGLVCIGCCWALMLLAFVAGTMNLVWMGVATMLMTLEKLRWAGASTGSAVGFALIAAGGFALASTA
ncbi:MAG: DUF2182 domain-containing protein [Chromatiales bacterium]|nr:DUF2182 domain-containing protein [Chromatiales bacterium]